MQRLLRRALWAMLTLILAVALAVWLVISNLDPNTLRDQFTNLASTASGYQVAVNGPFEIRVFPTPQLRAEQVSLTSPQTPGQPFAQVREVTLSIDLLSSLFRQDLVLGTATLSGTDITLIERDDGTGNWSPAPPSPSSPTIKKEPSDSVPTSAPPLLPKTLAITNLKLTFQQKKAEDKLHLQVSQAKLSQSGEGSPLQFVLTIHAFQRTAEIQGALQWPQKNTGESGLNLLTSLTLEESATQVHLKGTLPSLTAVAGIELEVEIKSARPQALLRSLPDAPTLTGLPRLGSVDFKGTIVGAANGQLSLQRAHLQLGDPNRLQLNVRGDIQDLLSDRRLQLEVVLTSSADTKSLAWIDPDLGAPGQTEIRGRLLGPIEHPQAQDLHVQITPTDTLSLQISGALDWQASRLGGQVQFEVKGEDTQEFVDFLSNVAGTRAGPLDPLRKRIEGLALGRKIWALKPLALSGRILGNGGRWTLDGFKFEAGPQTDDHLSISGTVSEFWPEPQGYAFEIAGTLAPPGPLPGIANNRIERLEGHALYRRQSGTDPGQIENLSLQATGEAGTRVSAQGDFRLDPANGFNQGTLDVEISAPSLQPLARVVGFTLPNWGPVELRSRIEASEEKINLTLRKSQIGKAQIDGVGSLDRTGPVPSYQLELKADRFDIAALSRWPTDADVSAQHAASQSEPTFSPSRLAWIRDTAGQIDLSVNELIITPNWSLTDFMIGAQWANGLLQGPSGQSRSAGHGHFDLRSQLDARTNPPAVKTAFRGDKFPIQVLLDWMGYPGAASGELLAVLDLSAEGAGTEKLLSSLDGRGLFDVGDGTIASKYVDQLSLDLVPNTRQKARFPMECLIADFTVDQGLVRSENFLWRSGPAQMRGAGVINLPKETLDWVLRPHLEQVLATKVTAAIRIKGPIKNPRIYPEPLQTATDLVRGVLGRALGLVGRVSPQFSKAVTKIGGETNKALSATGIDNKLILSVLAEPVDCKKIRETPSVQALSAFDPSAPVSHSKRIEHSALE